MAVKIRLRRIGRKNSPWYRVIAAGVCSPRDGRCIEETGYSNPVSDPVTISIDAEKAAAWIKNGAQPTETVKALLKKSNVL